MNRARAPYAPRALSLTQKTFVGAIWTITSSVGSRAMGLVATLIITRFVAPAEYGEVMAAVVVIETTSFLFNAGLGQYIVVHPKEGRDTAFHSTFYNCGIGFLGLGLVTIFREPIGPLFGAPGLSQYVPLLALAWAITLLSFVPNRILNRDLRFRNLSVGRTLGELTYSGLGVFLAWRGHGAMSIVLANVGRSVVASTFYIGSVKWRDWIEPCRLSWTKTKSLFAFGIPLWLSNLAEMGARRWDNAIIILYFGTAAGGKYNFAYNLADVPATNIGEHIGDVLVPSFARMEDPEQRKRALVRSMGLLALAVFPLAVGLGAISETLIDALFDERWAGIAPMLAILSALSVTRPVGWVMQCYILAKDRTRTIGVLEVVKAILVVASVATIGRFGVLWACIAVGIAYALHALLSVWAVKRADGLPVLSVIKPLIAPLVACLPMAAAVYGIRYVCHHVLGTPTGVNLVIELLVGAISYVISGLLIARKQSADLLGLVKEMLARRRNRNQADSSPDSDAPPSEP